MAADFEVRGANDFLRLSKGLKEAGEKGLRRELNKSIRNATKPLLPIAAQALAAGLPSRLQGRGRRVRQVVQVKTGRDPGVSIAVPYGKRNAGGLGASNARLVNARGVVRHPLYGNRQRWCSTPAPGAQGWFDETYTTRARTVLPDVERAVERVAGQITRRVGR